MQAVIVTLIVLVAAGYAAWYAMPRRWRAALARRVGSRRPQLAAVIARDPGCGACESCGPCSTPPKETTVAAPVSRHSRSKSPTA
ncbi:MAG: hypothetical protein J0H69_05160 [Burkholderiales bacterium]|jgi:hypothetical protein|nr:hypothetical protein [Burkholderiales bacterium]